MSRLAEFHRALDKMHEVFQRHLPEEVFREVMHLFAWDKIHTATVSCIRGMAVAINRLGVGDEENPFSAKARLLADIIKEVYGKDAVTFSGFLHEEFNMMTGTRARDLSILHTSRTSERDQTTLLFNADYLASAAITLIIEESKTNPITRNVTG